MRLFRIAIPLVLVLLYSLTAAAYAPAVEWQVNEETLGSHEISKESISSSGEEFKIYSEGGIDIKCESESGTGTIATGGTSTALMEFSGCEVVGNPFCDVNTSGQSSETIEISSSPEFLEVEAEGSFKYFDEISLIAIIEFTGPFCTYPEEMELSGVTAAKIPVLGDEQAKRTQKFSGAIEEESGVDGLFLGEEPAVLTGEITQELAGAHEQQPVAQVPINVNPSPITIAGGVGKKADATITRAIDRNITLDEVGVTGPFGLTDPNDCNEKVLMAAPKNACTVTVQCNEAKPGRLFVLLVTGMPMPHGVRTKIKC